MAKWIMPHEDMPVELATPQKASSKFVMPHELEVDEAKVKTPAQMTLEAESPLSRGFIGAGQAMSDVLQGAKQTAGMILSNQWPQQVSQDLASNREARSAISSDPYASGGKLAANVGLGLATPITKYPKMASTAFGAAIEGPLKPREEPTTGNMVTDAAEGALGGLAGGTLGQYLTSGVARSKNALKGRFASPEQQNRFRIFKENLVPGSLGDITQNPTIMSLENAAQHIPFTGRKAFMEQQAGRLGEVVKGAPEKIAGGVPSGTKEDLGGTLVRSVKEKYAINKSTARDLYDAVSARVQAVGAPPVPTTELASETQKLLSKYPTAFAKLTEDPATVRALEEIASGVSPQASKILGPSGKPIMKAPQLGFDELRALDSDLGALIRQGRTLSARGEYNNKTFQQLANIQKALRKDIDNWSSAVGDPQISKGVKNANKFYRENVLPFRENPTTRKIIQDQDVNQDTIADQMFKLDSPWLSEQSTGFLTPEGIQAGRYHLLKQAEQKAMNDSLESGFSPSQFLRKSQLGESGDKLFSSHEMGQLGDLQELIRSSRRAGSYASDPSTGNRLLSLAPLASMKVPLAGRAFSTLAQSEAPLRFMLADPRLYTGAGGLGRASEAVIRKLPIGAVANREDLMNTMEEPTEY